MTKRNNIIYWIATIWLALGMTSAGIVQIIQLPEEVTMFNHIGFPVYIMLLLGLWKIAGVIAILLPKFPLVKEWAYAGFFFTATGALFSHIKTGGSGADIFGPALLIVLTIVSWYFRPESRRVLPV